MKKCALTGKLIEINSNSFSVRPGSDANCRQVAKLCQQYQVPVIVSSDAHSCYSVGNHDAALQMLEELEFPEELVINSSMERLAHYFSKRAVY